MELRLFPPSRLQAQTTCAIIADAAHTGTIEEVTDSLAEEILSKRPKGRPSIANYQDDLVTLLGRDNAKQMVVRSLKACYPANLHKAKAERAALSGAQMEACFAALEAGWLGYEIGEEIRDETQFDEWWYEWNEELDEAFFDWVDDMFDGSSFPDDGGYADFCYA